MTKQSLSWLLALAIIICLPLSGCYDAKEIDEEVYALVIGVDEGVQNKIRLTFQYATYKEGGGKAQGGGGNGGDEESGEVDGTIVATIEASSLLEGINLINATVNRQISLMHAKMLVFSEEYAREGVAKYVEPLVRFREVREFMRIVVCKGKAEDFIKENRSFIGSNPAKNIELIFEQSKNTGYFPDVFFSDFYQDLLTPYGQPTAIYAGVNDLTQMASDVGTGEPPLRTEEDYEPGSIPRKGGTKKELSGTAVFDGDRMVGTLSQRETRFFLMGIGEFKRGFFTLEDPNIPGYIYVLEIRLAGEPKLKARFANAIPVIDLELSLDINIISIQSRKHYEKLANIPKLETEVKLHFEKGLRETIEKTQTEWNADIFHFGRKIAGNFGTIEELEAYNWNRHYQEAKVNVKVNTHLRRSGFLFEAAPVHSSTTEGEQKE